MFSIHSTRKFTVMAKKVIYTGLTRIPNYRKRVRVIFEG